ncbi:MAG: metallophosphoesterase [Lachnospiraceae bacterium]|nr:metallophosphoesterase [Lachnospiraceae bacterium]
MWEILGFVFAIFILVVFWIILFDTNRFVVRKMEICDKRIKGQCRVVVLSDLHNKRYGRDNCLLLEKIREQKPDAIFMAGDILTAKPGKTLDIATHFVRELAKDYPIYYGNGNHEHRIKLYPETYGDMAQEYAKALKECGVKPLVNEKLEMEACNIVVYGAEIARRFYKRFRTPHMEEGYLQELLGEPDKEKYVCLLAHNPDYFPQYAAWGADLVCAGHVHGGMVRIPGFKGVVSPSVHFFPKYDGGIFVEGAATMLLSRGLGMHTIPIRMFNPGEFTVVDFKEN